MTQIEGKRILITGGAGFIGSTLAGRLVQANEVVVLDNLSRDSLTDKPFADHANLTRIVGDVLDLEDVARAVKGAEIIIHCAAIAGIDTVTISPVRTMRVNMVGSANVLEAAARQDRVERVVCFSTSEVFGSRAFQVEETHDTSVGQIGEARWTYAVSKLAEEHLAMAYYHEQGLPVVAVRPFNVYGPGQIGEGALKAFVQWAICDKPIEIHGDGTQIRAWCYVDDMVDGVLLCLVHPKAVGESFNIGNARAVVTITGLANTVLRVTGSKSEIVYTWKDYADVELRVPSVAKARDVIGFEAAVDLEEGILRTAAHYRQQMAHAR